MTPDVGVAVIDCRDLVVGGVDALGGAVVGRHDVVVGSGAKVGAGNGRGAVVDRKDMVVRPPGR